MDYIIINDSISELIAGDVRVYSSRELAISSLDIDDCDDYGLFIYNNLGKKIFLKINKESNCIELIDSDLKFKYFHNLLLDHANNLEIQVENDWSDQKIICSIYIKNPDPYCNRSRS